MSDHPVQIVRLTPGNSSLLGAVLDDVFDEPVDASLVEAYLHQPGHCMMLALHDGNVVAQAAAVVHRHPDKPTELYIDEVGVAPAYQRRGIARRLLEGLFAFGREAGCEEVWVGTEPDNLPARALYEHLRAEGDAMAETFVMYVYRL